LEGKRGVFSKKGERVLSMQRGGLFRKLRGLFRRLTKKSKEPFPVGIVMSRVPPRERGGFRENAFFLQIKESGGGTGRMYFSWVTKRGVGLQSPLETAAEKRGPR